MIFSAFFMAVVKREKKKNLRVANVEVWHTACRQALH